MSFLNTWYEDTISEKDGYLKGRGLGAALLKPFVDEGALEGTAQRTANQNTALAAGEDLSDLDVGPGASTLAVQGAAIRRGRDRVSEGKEKDHGRSIETLTESMKPQMAQITASVKAQEAQTGLMREQMLAQARESNLTRAENAEIRADQMALQRLQMEREDQRYNERMERLDKKDRMQGRQSLIAGLAALGAAFAL